MKNNFIYRVCMLSHFSCVQLFVTPWTVAHQTPLSMDFPGKNTGVGCHFLLQGIFPTQGLNPGLPHCRRTLYQLRTREATNQVSVQFSSVQSQSCLTLCHPMNRSTPGLPVHHHLPEFTKTHVHRVGDAIQPSHPLSSPFPPAPYPSQHSLFQ